jgi:hypothetical protein
LDVPLTGINLGSGNPIQVTIGYDGAALTETVRDTITGAVFFHVYKLNLAQTMQTASAFAGFTGGTGGESALQDIVNWTGTFQQPVAQPAAALVVNGFPFFISAGSQGPLTVRALDQFGTAVSGYRGTIHFTSTDPAAVFADNNGTPLAGNNYTFTDTDNGVHNFSITLNTPGTQSITATDTVTASITGTEFGITVVVSGGPTIDFSNGFSNNTNLTANGSAFFSDTSSALGTFAGHQDIGILSSDPVAPGSATFDSASGAYTLRASGSDIWDITDKFQYLYKPLVGDGEIVARITSATAQDFWTKAGLMIRTDMSSHAVNDFMMYTPDSGHKEPIMHWRDNFNQNSAEAGTGASVSMPMWLRLNRTGNVFTGYWALDNNGAPGTWNVLPSHTTSMPNAVYVGLALTAHNNNGSLAQAVFDHVTITGNTAPLQPAIARLTDGAGGEAGSIFTNSRVLDNLWTTTFVLQDTDVNNRADNLSFVMQNDSRGANAVGGSGGAGGYAGIQNSFAIKFDLWSNGTHVPTTGLFVNGQSPASPNSQDIPLAPIDLAPSGQAGHPLRVTLTYNGTTLTETIVDTVNGAMFTHDYLVNLQQILGGNTAYVGFTGGTGGATALQDILSWTGQFPAVQPQATYLSITPTQLVTNGGFEASLGTTIPGWTRTGDTSADSVIWATDARVHSGTHVYRIGPDNLVFLTQTLATTPGVNYTLSFWLSNPVGGSGTEWLVRVGGTTLADVTNPPSFNFTRFTFNFTATNSSTDLQFGFKHPPDWFYLDDVSVTPTSTTAGSAYPVTVTALDAGGHRVGYTGTVTATSTDPQLVPFNTTFTAAANGQLVIPVTLTTAGTQTVFMTDTGNPLLTASTIVGVSPAAASALVVTNFPSPTTAGSLGAVLVTAMDPYNNVATGYRGTVHLMSSDLQAVLQGDHMFTAADNGRFAFAATLKTAGTQSITATDTTITGMQSGIVVTPAATSTFVVSGFPTPITAGTTGSFTVTAYDAYGNLTPAYAGTVHFTSTDPQATAGNGLPADSTLINGTGTFSATLKTAGTQSITVTDTANPGTTGTQAGIQVTPAAAVALVVAGFPSTALRMQAYSFTVTAVDAYGNVATGYTGTIHFFSDEDHADLPDDYSFTAADSGTHTFIATFNRFGTFYLGAVDTSDPSIFGRQTGIDVTN